MKNDRKDISGILLLNKPIGISSQTAVSKVKNLLSAKKAGHLGTLDPLASGVLPVSLGKCTRLFDYFLNKTKKYQAVFAFGFETTTLDCEGEITNFSNSEIKIAQIIEILNNFIGEIDQIPPSYSAKNINGQKAYQLARKGQSFELKPKKITIFDLKVKDIDENLKKSSINNFKKYTKSEEKEKILNNYFKNLFVFEIECSAGTYIRSLARDIAKALNTFGTMVYLSRIKCGEFKLQDCVSFEDIENNNFKLLKAENVINLESINIDDESTKKLLCGQNINITFEGQKKLFCNDKFLGIASAKNGKLKIDTYLLEE